MYNPENAWGTDMPKTPQACKIRLSKVYRREGGGLSEMMAELKSLTDKDIEDFKRWFAEAGFPCT